MYLKDLMQGEKYAFYSIVKYLVTIDGEFAKEDVNIVVFKLMQVKTTALDVEHQCKSKWPPVGIAKA